MTTARDVMHTGTQCIGEDQNLIDAARMMRDLGVGSLPICGADDKLHGMLTDRDIVVKCLAEGADCATTTVGSLAQGRVFFVDADADIDGVLAVMEEHQVRRVPVIENHRLVGFISESDLSRSLDAARIQEFVGRVYSPA
jgi:CBS domain-containing protein